jgi:hypothetical protein
MPGNSYGNHFLKVLSRWFLIIVTLKYPKGSILVNTVNVQTIVFVFLVKKWLVCLLWQMCCCKHSITLKQKFCFTVHHGRTNQKKIITSISKKNNRMELRALLRSRETLDFSITDCVLFLGHTGTLESYHWSLIFLKTVRFFQQSSWKV